MRIYRMDEIERYIVEKRSVSQRSFGERRADR